MDRHGYASAMSRYICARRQHTFVSHDWRPRCICRHRRIPPGQRRDGCFSEGDQGRGGEGGSLSQEVRKDPQIPPTEKTEPVKDATPVEPQTPSLFETMTVVAATPESNNEPEDPKPELLSRAPVVVEEEAL